MNKRTNSVRPPMCKKCGYASRTNLPEKDGQWWYTAHCAHPHIVNDPAHSEGLSVRQAYRKGRCSTLCPLNAWHTRCSARSNEMGYVISIKLTWSTKSYFAEAGGYTRELALAKVFTSYKEADAQLMVLAGANTAVAKYGKVEEARHGK